MAYDKISGKVGYNDASHTYTHIDDGRRYISVTTLIHQFVPVFDGQYWATYKAVKDVLDKVGLWWRYKKQAGGWEKVVAYYNKHGYNALAPDIEARKHWYLNKWEAEKNQACDLGSDIHNELEGAAIHAQEIREGNANYEVTQEGILDAQDFSSNRLYPELLIYNDQYGVAGQADKVFKEDLFVDIHDYKTCKSIDTEGFREETLLAPLTHLQNANYWIYALQLSMYGWMLEELGYKVRNLQLHWIHGENRDDKTRNAGVKTYKLPYLKTEVGLIMLNKK